MSENCDLALKYRIRVIASPGVNTLRDNLQKVQVSGTVIENLAHKAEAYGVLINDVSAAQAHILKETILSLCGDTGVHRELIMHSVHTSSVVLLGTLRQFSTLSEKMAPQPFKLKEVAEMVECAVKNHQKQEFEFRFRNRCLNLRKPVIMGILNVTPDSFSDGGKFNETQAAVAQALRMIEEGAAIIDIGGESSRPGAEPVQIQTELSRVLPVITEIRKRTDVPISIDTYKPEVADEAMKAGADIINDISGARNPQMLEIAAKTGAGFVTMHMLGLPRNMQQDPRYIDVIAEIYEFLLESRIRLVQAGVHKDKIVLDVGFGFGKTAQHNLTLLKYLNQFRTIGCPLLAGLSRKSLFGIITGASVNDRLIETIAAHDYCLLQGAKIIRTHDVKEANKAFAILESLDSLVE